MGVPDDPKQYRKVRADYDRALAEYAAATGTRNPRAVQPRRAVVKDPRVVPPRERAAEGASAWDLLKTALMFSRIGFGIGVDNARAALNPSNAEPRPTPRVQTHGSPATAQPQRTATWGAPQQAVPVPLPPPSGDLFTDSRAIGVPRGANRPFIQDLLQALQPEPLDAVMPSTEGEPGPATPSRLAEPAPPAEPRAVQALAAPPSAARALEADLGLGQNPLLVAMPSTEGEPVLPTAGRLPGLIAVPEAVAKPAPALAPVPVPPDVPAQAAPIEAPQVSEAPAVAAQNLLLNRASAAVKGQRMLEEDTRRGAPPIITGEGVSTAQAKLPWYINENPLYIRQMQPGAYQPTIITAEHPMQRELARQGLLSPMSRSDMGAGPMSRPWEEPFDPNMPESWFTGSEQGTDFSYEYSDAEMQRRRALGRSEDVTSFTANVEVKPMTPEAYWALTKEQRRAVDFNGLLYAARERDLNRDASTISEERMAKYAKDSERIFGKEGGSKVAALSTVALLKRIDWQGVGQDLDEFLSMERGFSENEVKNFNISDAEMKQLDDFVNATPPATQISSSPSYGNLNPPRTPAQGQPTSGYPATANPKAYTPPSEDVLTNSMLDSYMDVRSWENMHALNAALLNGMESAYQEKVKSNAPNTWSVQSALGPKQTFKPGQIPPGYGRGAPGSYEAQVDLAMEDMYRTLLVNPTKEGLGLIHEGFEVEQWTPEEQQMVWEYINNRTRMETDHMSMENAQKVRDILGWED